MELAEWTISGYRGQPFAAGGSRGGCRPWVASRIVEVLAQVKPLSGADFGAPEVTAMGSRNVAERSNPWRCNPLPARETNPLQVDANRQLSEKLAKVFRLWGYDEVSPRGWNGSTRCGRVVPSPAPTS